MPKCIISGKNENACMNCVGRQHIFFVLHKTDDMNMNNLFSEFNIYVLKYGVYLQSTLQWTIRKNSSNPTWISALYIYKDYRTLFAQKLYWLVYKSNVRFRKNHSCLCHCVINLILSSWIWCMHVCLVYIFIYVLIYVLLFCSFCIV